MGRPRKAKPLPELVLTETLPEDDLVLVKPLPEHSPLGASSAERWMHCPGSVALIREIADKLEHDDPDYRRDGTQAHELAAWCLNNDADCWEADAALFPALTGEMMAAVQTYLDYVRTLPGTRAIELRLHRPEFHPQAFGTLDFSVIAPGPGGSTEIVDYKHGVGVSVDAEHNPQLMYYAYLLLRDAGRQNADLVKLTIVQPRGFHPDGPIRSWTTTAGEIWRWAHEELKPAMDATADAEYLDMGSWCRFCPAKIACPAMNALGAKALTGAEITYPEAQQLKMLIKAVEDRAYQALLKGDEIDGAKLVAKKTDRVFKDEAPIEETFSEEAWEPQKLRSPAQIAKLLGGKEFVAEWAYSPEAGYTVALASDKRSGVTPKTGQDKFGAAVAALAAE